MFLGYKVEIVIPEKASNETKEIIRNLGAKVYETSDDSMSKSRCWNRSKYSLATSIASSRPDTYYSPNQYANEANFMGHYKEQDPKFGNKLMEK